DPGQRIAGAWREVTDALRLAGRPVGDDLAASEVAERARRAIAEAREATASDGDPPPTDVDDLARLLNRVAFAPGTATPEQAERATAMADRYVSALRAARPWWRRLLWSVHPGPLRWRR
ncbi:transglutaminase, partial [Micromonospora globispora]